MMKTLEELSIRKGEYGGGFSAIDFFDGAPRYIRITDIDADGKLNDEIKAPSGNSEEWEKYKLIEGDILFARSGATVGKSFLYEKSNIDCVFAGYLIRFRPNKEIALPKYVYYYTKTPSYFAWIKNKQNVVAQPNINAKQYGTELQIPLPPLPTQQKIAAILDEADKLRQLNKRLIAKYEALSQSLFLEMFGDPVSNPKGWEKVKGSKLYEVKGRVGWKGYKKTDLRDNGPLVLGATHINKGGYLTLSKPVFLSEEKYLESPEIMIEINDLIFVQRGNTIGKVGIVSYDIGEATINPVVLILRPHKTNSLFILNLLLNNQLKQRILELNSGSAQPMITQKSMNEYEFINPPIALQNLFAERIQAIEQQKAQAQQALAKSEDLFNSLLQRAFITPHT
ncbi:restriction endonuclease subunit S [Carboxylicivirga marina]|uniref:restriction endonuclease subunit S n=1 Tax=Carboxylicivirga marina TaxID=2800988 RepID=UPI002595DF3B|nr:restriction endonuclease subunit S [uncultured Carboxylicivirga sp.]